MKTRLKYGTDGLEVELPETPGFAGVLRPADPPTLDDPAGEVERALLAPIDSPPLRDLARGRSDAVIVISDITRAVPNALLLPPIIATLEEAGIEPEAITILIATGLHRPNEGEELVRLVGRDVASRYRVLNHRSRNDDEMVLVGHIGDGTPAYVNERYVAADLKVLTGFIEPHMWAGFSGGCKSILPGLSSVRTVEFMHSPEMIAHPKTRYGLLEENPFHEAGLETMERTGADFVVNVTLDNAKRLTGVFAGHPVEAHRQGAAFLSRLCVKTLDEPLDFAVTTTSGAPLDCSLYQGTKGFAGVAAAMREGGVILLASECSEGLGSDDYRAVLERVTTPAEFLAKLERREFLLPDQWCAQETYQVMQKCELWVHSGGIDAETLRRLHFHPVASIERALEELLERFGNDARWAVVPDGPMLILRLA